jgi:hypothetical protein
MLAFASQNEKLIALPEVTACLPWEGGATMVTCTDALLIVFYVKNSWGVFSYCCDDLPVDSALYLVIVDPFHQITHSLGR